MKRLISMLLVCLMVLQMLPMGIHTHAQETETEPTVIETEAVAAETVTVATDAPTETAAPETTEDTLPPETTAEAETAPAETVEETVAEETTEETTVEETTEETLSEEEEILLPEGFGDILTEEAAGATIYWENEPNDNKYQADLLVPDTIGKGVLRANDLDYFAFQLTSKCKVTILALSARNTMWLPLFEMTQDKALAVDKKPYVTDNGNYGYGIEKTLSTGEYYVVIMDANMDHSYSYEYVLQLQVEPLYETCKHSKKKKIEKVEVTCGQDGYTTYYCSTCEYTWKGDIVPATGNHTYYDQYDSICDVCRSNRYLGIARGECGKAQEDGNNLMNWVLYDDGRMVISGWGDMQLNNGNGMPWDSYKSKIKTLEVKDEVFCISDHAFEDCTNLTSINLAGSVLNIENGAFNNCTSLSSVTLGEGVRRIGDETFGSCTALRSINIPSSVEEIDDGAFVLCDNLASIQVASGNTVYSSDSQGILYNKDKTEVMEIPQGIRGTVTIPGTVTSLGDTFSGCSKLTGAIIPDSVTNIPYACFQDCTALKSASLPKNLLVIPDLLFHNCTSLTSVEIPEQVNLLGESAFQNCSVLRSITIPASVTEIEEYCFYECSSLANITIPKSVTEIGYQAFAFCGQLKEITFEGDVPAMSDCFIDVTATAYYPITNATWTSSKKQNYGGSLTWVGKCIDGHIEVIDTPGIAPTCLEEGLSPDSHCSNCGEITSVQQVLPALGHDVVVDAYLSPTCLETGKTEGNHCGRCGEVLLAQKVIDALGHDKVVDAYLAPTCEETGLTEGSHCDRCELVFVAQNVIPALGHSYTNHWCTRCGQAEFVEVISIESDKLSITSGEQANLTAILDYAIREETEIIWTLAEGDEACATLEANRETAVLTANRLLEDAVVTVSAKTADGLHESVSIRITIRGVDSDRDLFAGKSLTLKPIDPATGKAYTAKQLTWTMDERYEPFASVKNGKVTARKVVQKERIEVTATVNATGEKFSYVIDIYPTITQLEVKNGEEVVNGKTILMDYSQQELVLSAELFPADLNQTVTWTVSDGKKLQYADYTMDGNTLTITNPKGKSGTITIKATVNAGVKKTVTVKVQFGTFAREVTIFEPAKTTIRGGETLALSAYISDPVVVTKPGIVWSVSDKNAATVSGGKVKAKNVAHPTTVTVTATSKDGQASASIDLEIIPKNEGQLVLMSGERFVSGTKAMNFGDTLQLRAYGIENGETVSKTVTWASSNGSVAHVADGLITATGVGTAKITAECGGQKTVINIKVSTLVADMEITTKDGKNLIEENGETMVIVSSGKGVNLVADILTKGANKAVTWEITEGGEYAKIAASGKLTANKDLTGVHYITVRATAKDGGECVATIRVKVVPLATGVQIFQNGSRVRSNTVFVYDMLQGETLKLNAKVYPAKANQAVELTSSNKKVADFMNGELVCYKPGTVTITAKALDGSNAKTTFKLTIIKKITALSLNPSVPVDENGSLILAGGKSLKLAPMVEISPSDATNQKLAWSVSDNDAGITISSSGVLKTKKVSQPVTVNVMVLTQDGSGLLLSFNVLVYPA